MASPQRENGFTGIANEILDNLSTAQLNGTQFRIIMVVFRYTYGFQRKEHELSETFLAKATGIHKQQIKRELKGLLDKNILSTVREATFSEPRIISFNKNYEQWVDKLKSTEVAKKIPGNENDTPTGSGLDTSPGSGLDTQERKLKESIKETTVIILNSDESAFMSVLESVNNYPIDREKDIGMYRALAGRYPSVDLLEAIKDWAFYKLDNPLKKGTNPRSQINTSFKKCVDWGKNLKSNKPKGRIGVTEGEGAGVRRDDM